MKPNTMPLIITEQQEIEFAQPVAARFWKYANTNTIYNSVILSLKEGREIYGVNCDPGFSGDVYYYGGAW